MRSYNSNPASAATPRKPRGRHPHQRLDALTVRQQREPGRYADGNGLYLVVDDSGAKRWIWRGLVHGRRCDLGLGGVTYVSLAEARDLARTYRQTARKGGNPKQQRDQQRSMPTFAEAAREVHREHSQAFKNPKHRAQWLASLEADAFPKLGELSIETITSADVLQVLTPIWLTKPETARRVKQRMKLVFDWAKAKRFRSGDNPTEGLTKVLPKHKGDKQHHAALPYRDVPTVLTALADLPDVHHAVRQALEFVILTATRTNEVLCAQWDEIDLKAKTWTIPATRMKAGKPHIVPLAARALAVLTEARTHASDVPWIFGRFDKPLSNMTLLKAARRLTTAPLTVHGFRSSFRDWSAEQTNVPRDVCEAALAHTIKDKTEAAYKRTDLLEKRRALMAQWATYVTTPPSGKVLPMSRRRARRG